MSGYSASSNANNFHSTPRGGNPNVLVGSNETDYAMGLVISGAVFIIIAILYCMFIPMYMCCCRKAKTKNFAAIKKRIIFFAACLGVGMCGCAMGFVGGASARDGLVLVGDVFNSMSDILNGVADSVSGNLVSTPVVPGIAGALRLMGEEFDLMDGIGCTAFLAGGLTSNTVASAVDAAESFREISDALTEQLEKFSDSLVEASGYQYNGTLAIFGLILAMFCLFASFMVCIHWRRIEKPAKCLSYFTQPISFLLCILCWILAAFLMMFGSFFGDMCQDPDALIADQTKNNLLIYYQTCTGGSGDGPNPLVTSSIDPIRDFVLSTQGELETLQEAVNSVCDTQTQKLFVSALNANDAISDSLDVVEGGISCQTLQPLYRDVIWGVLCGEVVDMFAFTFGACFCIAFSLFFVVPLYKQVMRNTQTDDDVEDVPEAYDEFGNPIVMDGETDTAAYDEDGNPVERDDDDKEGVEMDYLDEDGQPMAEGGMAEAQVNAQKEELDEGGTNSTSSDEEEY